MVNTNGTPSFGSQRATASAGCLRLIPALISPRLNNFVIGLGAAGDDNLIVPAAVIPADQNMAVNILPIVKFYVTKSDFVQGTVVDFQSVSKVAGAIDFSSGPGLGMFAAIVTHNPNGSFSTVYRSHANFNNHLSFDNLQQQITALEKKLVSINANVGDAFAWLATVTWATGVPIAGQMAGADAIAAYIATFKFAPPPGDEFQPDSGSIPPKVDADWKAAVLADAKDPYQHTASGIFPANKAPPSQGMVQAPAKTSRFLVKQFQSNGITAF